LTKKVYNNDQFLAMLSASLGAPAEPQLNCEFRMRSCCINQGATRVEMRQISADSRRWELEVNYLPGSSFAIIENKECGLGLADQAKEIERSEGVDEQGKRYTQVTYAIRKGSACSLAVRIPTGDRATVDNAYTFMITSIRLCWNDVCKGRVSCLGRSASARRR
jgi:hypothetical protein